MDRGFKARISGCRKYRYARRANFSVEFRRLILSARFLSNRIPQYVAITFSIYLIKLRLLNSLCEKSLLSWYQPKIRWRFGFYFEDRQYWVNGHFLSPTSSVLSRRVEAKNHLFVVSKMPAKLPSIFDSELIQQSRNGDESAYGQLVQKYQYFVCSVAYSRCGDLGMSEVKTSLKRRLFKPGRSSPICRRSMPLPLSLPPLKPE